MEEGSTANVTSDFIAYLSVIWRRKWIMIISVVAITSIAVAGTLFFSTRKYQSSTELLQRRSSLDKALLGSDFFQQSNVPDRDMQTAAALVSTPQVVSEVQKSLGDELGGKNPAALIDVSVSKSSDILTISATDTDPQLAADVANSFAVSYINWRRQVDQGILRQAREPIEAQLLATPVEQQDSANYKLLKNNLDNLKVMEAVQTGNMEVVKPALASSNPVSPRPIRTGGIAFLLSIVVGIGAIFLVDQFDNLVRNTDEITKNIDKPILGLIPKISSSNNGSLVTMSNPSGVCSEAYRLLKTNLSYIEPDSEIKSIMISSLGPGEGKTTTIANLAVTMARSGQRVIVLEADLRRPLLSKYMGLDDTVGLTNVIAGNCSLREALQMVEANDLAVTIDYDNGGEPWEQGYTATSIDGIKPIYCATSGPIPPNPGELASSNKLAAIVAEASEYADIVLIDSPPLGVVGDAASMASRVDGVVLVVMLEKTAKKSLKTMQAFIDTVPCKVLGMIATGSRTGRSQRRNSYYEKGVITYGHL